MCMFCTYSITVKLYNQYLFFKYLMKVHGPEDPHQLRIWILIMNATAVLTHLLPQGNKRKGADIA